MTPRSRLGHLPALDGLRAAAVIGVFLFHAGVVPGGFVGVDVFFVVSGFLITALAITEIEESGRLRLGAFWARRARRLLPAVFVLCAAVVVASAALGGGFARRVGRDVFATLAYAANWTQVGEGRDYFARYETPSLLHHAWSLAIEEQFYVVWPLALAGVGWLARRRALPVRVVVGGLALSAATASVAAAWWWSRHGVAVNRLYYGTDTRAVGLALGSAAACALANGEATGSRRIGRLETIAALAGSVALVGLALAIDGSERWLYGPGFLLIAGASIVVVTAASGVGPIAVVLSSPVLAGLGRVSYGVYLWHWPVIVVLNGERTGLGGPALGAVWVAVTAVLTAGSWFLIEQRSLPPAIAHPRRLAGYVAAALAVSLGAAATVSAARVGTPTPAVPEAATAVAVTPTASPVSAVTTPGGRDGVAGPGDGAAITAPSVVAPESRPPLRVLVLGDSVAWSLGTHHAQPMAVDGFGPVEVRNAGVIACPILRIGTPFADDGYPVTDDPAVCLGDDRFADEIAAFEPDLVVSLFEWSGFGGGRRLADGTELRPCDQAFDVAWADEYETLAERIAGSARVVVATVAPPVKADPTAADGSRCMNAELARRNLPTFDYAGWICPDGDCRRYATLRPDGTHFSRDRDVQTQVLSSLVGAALAAAGFTPGA